MASDNKRALKVIRDLRNSRRKQSEKIDILCHDMVSAHRDFSMKMAQLNFVVSFHESLLRCTEMEELLDTAVKGIRDAVCEADAAVILLSENGFDVHIADHSSSEPVEKKQFRHWFTRNMVNTISQMNRICTLDELLRMGLQGPPGMIKTVSLAAIPLGRLGQGVGCILLYRRAEMPLQTEELSRVAAISGGLREAIQSFRDIQSRSSSNRMHV